MSTQITTYLQKAGGDTLDDVSMKDIIVAIGELKEMDDEHDAFWVGIVNDDENVLEVQKDLTIFGMFPNEPEKQIRKQAANWKEIEDIYKLFLKGDFTEVKKFLREK